MTVTVVVGPPCAGKSTWVRENSADGDVVVDFDAIATALGGTVAHAPGEDVKDAAVAARAAVVDMLLDGGAGADGWVIHSKPGKATIARYEEAGAVFVLLDPGKDECLARAAADGRPDGTAGWIEGWYADPPHLPATAAAAAGAASGAVVPERPVLATVRRVPLGEVGTWDISNIAGWTVTRDDFASAVAALDCPAVRRPVLKFGHTGGHGKGDPTLGCVDNLAVSEDGLTLYGDFTGMPAWLAEVDADGNSVLSSAYPDRSGEWEFPHYCQLGHKHPFVLTAVALLGVERPGIGTLASLHDLYTTAPEKEKTMAKTTRAAASVNEWQVRDAYYATLPEDDYSWVREMYISPPELIVEAEDGGLLRVPYTVGEDESVTFGEAQKVELVYVEAQASAGRRQAAFASAAESRNTRRARTAEGETVDETEDQGAAYTALRDGLIERLGVTDPAASDEDLLAALDEALAEQPEAPAAAAASRLPQGVVTIEEGVLAELRTQAAAGAAARAQQQREAREALVSRAVSEGRIPPARRPHWLTQLEVDHEGATAALASLQPGTIPVTGAIGHANTASETEENALYESLFGKGR